MHPYSYKDIEKDPPLDIYPIPKEVVLELDYKGLCKSRNVNFVTKHAIDRWKERAGVLKDISDNEMIRRVIKCFCSKDSKEVFLLKKFKVLNLLNHKFKPARYYKTDVFLFVVEDDIIKTVHNAGAGRWE